MRQGFPLLVLAAAFCSASAIAGPTSVLFVGNSYTFGRNDPVMSYNSANVHDLTYPMWLKNSTNSNVFEPHPWGGVPGIFKQFTVEAGLEYEVSLSARNAASLRGHFLNSNPDGWDLRGNIAAQKWDKVVLQENSDEPLPRQPGLGSNPEYFKTYANLIENYIHGGAALAYRERDLIGGSNAACSALTGASATACGTLRNIPANPNANADADVYLYQTWARPNLINAPYTTTTNPITGEVSFTSTPATSYYPGVAAMTADLKSGYQAAADLSAADGTAGIKAIAPVGEAFLRAVMDGVATPNMYGQDALTDGLIDLWFADGTHASKWGSYLSALTLFGSLTGLDPQSLGAQETAAMDLGISQADAVSLQRVAALQLGFSLIPGPSNPASEPPGIMVFGIGLVAIAGLRRKQKRKPAGR